MDFNITALDKHSWARIYRAQRMHQDIIVGVSYPKSSTDGGRRRDADQMGYVHQQALRIQAEIRELSNESFETAKLLYK